MRFSTAPIRKTTIVLALGGLLALGSFAAEVAHDAIVHHFPHRRTRAELEAMKLGVVANFNDHTLGRPLTIPVDGRGGTAESTEEHTGVEISGHRYVIVRASDRGGDYYFVIEDGARSPFVGYALEEARAFIRSIRRSSAAEEDRPNARP